MLAVAWLNAHLIIIVLVVVGGLGYLVARAEGVAAVSTTTTKRPRRDDPATTS